MRYLHSSFFYSSSAAAWMLVAGIRQPASSASQTHIATSRASDVNGMCVVLEPGQFLSYRGSIRSDVELTNKNDGYNIYDTAVSPELSFNERANTRGNKLHNQSFHYDLRKHFSLHVLQRPTWNSLPNSVVDACTVNAFKSTVR